MSFGSGFHGGIAAGIILGGLIVGAQIIGSTIQTAASPPYWELGPGINASNPGGTIGTFPAIQAVSANSGVYDALDPALIYVDDGTDKFLMLTAGEETSTLLSQGQLLLASNDSAGTGLGPGMAQLTGNAIFIGTSVFGFAINLGNPNGFSFLGTLLDQNGEIIPSFFPIGQTLTTSVLGGASFANPAGTTNVKVVVYCSGGNFIWKVVSVTATTITVTAFSLPGAAAVTVASNINISGYVVKVAG